MGLYRLGREIENSGLSLVFVFQYRRCFVDFYVPSENS